MAPNTTCHLPNGQNLTVTPVFGGLYFKSNELAGHHGAAFPPGWTVVLNSEDSDSDDEDDYNGRDPSGDLDIPRSSLEPRPVSYPSSRAGTPKSASKPHMVHRYTRPTLRSDHLFISSISQPNNADFKPVTSPSRQIAMMLWATLWWYFHQPEPDARLHTKASEHTKEQGKPKGEWRININREGVFKSKVVLPKLERMGLISSEESYVGSEDGEKTGEGWKKMFVSRRAFWQLDARIYLFTMAPTSGSPFPSSTPVHSRPGSPNRQVDERREIGASSSVGTFTPTGAAHHHSASNPFHSSSHLPTYYPPPPTQFVMTDGVIHPLRPKPPRPGETFYTRYVPSVGQYLSFRAASSSLKPHVHNGPVSSPPLAASIKERHSDSIVSTMQGLNIQACDCELLHKWMNQPRVSEFWGTAGPQSVQDEFLRKALKSKHSFPVIGCWDGKPFGYFEIYWVKEDQLGRYAIDVGNYDRGLHVLVGEEEFRGPHRVRIWLSALVHFCWLADNRTECVMMEPRVDNEKLLNYAMDVGFYKQTEISFPHKQANLLRIRRDAWNAPVL
ncbi:uncharacterized protein PV09_06289 [Verruconis gallopava]|uniref:Acyltransferase MbtK/IucB-like conserved domain-containing protein n=1 Tax=Verruconis gallopava TaxID=253628 RepID=A0A0D1XJL2_9PEZI|nr:uncharacterized protein PV09_06289 [Verruconis gallopava]KIW02486.1 hypothetical protein PV09_06289 [Verruconis gallopava]